MNKRKLSFLMLCMCVITSFTGCSDDDNDFKDVDGQVPAIAFTSTHIQSDLGYEFIIKGKVEDADGLKSIRLQNAQLNLDKTIDLLTLYKELLFSYDLEYLEYGFKTPRNQEGDRFEILVTVTDVGGRTTESTVLVTMDGDFEAPVFTAAPDKEVAVVIKNETKYILNFTATDNREIDNVSISVPEINYSKIIPGEGKSSLSFNETIILPSEAAVYNLTLVATDKAGLTTKKESQIKVDKMPDFANMYLADVATAEELNSDVFGVPMLVDHIGEYQYEANYYCQKADTEVFFLPQKTDFTPVCFGLDPDDNTKLLDDSEKAEPIVLTEANVYYKIKFDINELTYSISTYPIAEAINPIPHVIGTISLDTWGDGGSWLQEFYIGYMTGSPKEIQRFTQDAVNPNLFSLEGLELTAGEEQITLTITGLIT